MASLGLRARLVSFLQGIPTVNQLMICDFRLSLFFNNVKIGLWSLMVLFTLRQIHVLVSLLIGKDQRRVFEFILAHH